MLDANLASLYGVTTKRLNEQVKRNIDRFPDTFMFQLTKAELDGLKSQNVTSSWGGRRKLPYVFREHGVVYGPAGQASGVGIYFWVEDIDGNGWKDIVAPGEDGLFLFKNLGNK